MNTINPYRLFHGAFLPNWLLERPEVSAGAKLVYARLCQFADKETGIAWPRQEDLANAIGLKERQVRNHVTELIGHGLIVVRQVGLQQPNQYAFLGHKWIIPDRQHSADPDRQDIATQDRQDIATPSIYRESKERKESRRKPDFGGEEIPESLQPHSEILREYERHRKALGKPLTPMAWKRKFAFLARQPDPAACVEQTLSKGWIDLFEVKTEGNGQVPPKPRIQPPDLEELRAAWNR